jgi:hypothetical protein
MLYVLAAYLKREQTVVMLCERFGIAVSTLYRWKKRLLSQEVLFLGSEFSLRENALRAPDLHPVPAIRSNEETTLAFLDNLIKSIAQLSGRLEIFFRIHGFSFMENFPRTPRLIPP